MPMDADAPPPYRNADTAPFIYFDFAPTFGIIAGAIGIELAARILIPGPGGEVKAEVVPTARLRCSPEAANELRNALSAALQMLDGAQGAPPSATGRLN